MKKSRWRRWLAALHRWNPCRDETWLDARMPRNLTDFNQARKQ